MFSRNATFAQAALATTSPAIGLALCDSDLPAGAGLAMAVHAVELALAGTSAPEWVQLIPAGHIKARDGREWHLDDPVAVAAASLAEGLDLPIDYDHAIDLAKTSGGRAPAAGWIKAIEFRPGAEPGAPGALWARVEWTERGRAAVAAREWRYLSPVFLFTKDSKRVLRVMRAALTNDPAIAMVALAHRQQETPTMNPELLKQLAKTLGNATDGADVAIGPTQRRRGRRSHRARLPRRDRRRSRGGAGAVIEGRA